MMTKKVVPSSLLLVLLALVLAVPAAEAHSRYVRSEPAFASVLKDPPQRVTIWFSEELDKGSQIRVTNQQGDRVDDDKTEVSLSDPKSMSVDLKAISKGAYLVEWVSISLEDKDRAEGSFTFSVSESGSQALPGAAVIMSILALVIAAIALLRSRRRAT